MYKEGYKDLLQQIEDYKINCLESVTNLFKTIHPKPIFIGNMVYYICKDEYCGNIVPAYCYKSDYTGNEQDFKPIYDMEKIGDYGWHDFLNVVTILDVIRENINLK